MTLAEYLQWKGLTQEAFGQKIGLTQGRISQIMREGTDSIDTSRKIYRATDGAVNLFGVEIVASEAAQ